MTGFQLDIQLTGAVVALAHDVLFTVGLFALLQIEFDLPVLAAVLAVIGYSLNDTIVVFDRIRENMKLRRRESYREVINRSINETLSRTIVTSLTTLFVAFYNFMRPHGYLKQKPPVQLSCLQGEALYPKMWVQLLRQAA